jgi:hypothetical protein
LLQQRGSGKGQEGGAGSRSQGEEGKSIKKRLPVEGDGLGEGGEERRRDIIYSHIIRRGVGTGGPSARTYLLVDTEVCHRPHSTTNNHWSAEFQIIFAA